METESLQELQHVTFCIQDLWRSVRVTNGLLVQPQFWSFVYSRMMEVIEL